MTLFYHICAHASPQIRYLDGAGNLHFVPRVKDVPPQYRGQLSFKSVAEIAIQRMDRDPQSIRRVEDYNRERYTFKRNVLPRGGMRRVWRPRSNSTSGF
jgi:hypothetical protein